MHCRPMMLDIIYLFACITDLWCWILSSLLFTNCWPKINKWCVSLVVNCSVFWLFSGGYKGYGLAMMVEVFCGILAGAAVGPNIRRWTGDEREANLVSIPLSVEGMSASFGKSSLKHSKNFRIISSNQKPAWALTSASKAIARTNTSCCLATSGRKPRAQSLLGEVMSPSIGTCSPDCLFLLHHRQLILKKRASLSFLICLKFCQSKPSFVIFAFWLLLCCFSM